MASGIEKPKGRVVATGVHVAESIYLSKSNSVTTVQGAEGGFFSPGQPLDPMGPQTSAGRAFDYPVGININLRTGPDNGVDFFELRALADLHDVTRLLIETRKDQMEALKWEVRPIQKGRKPGEKIEATPDQQKRIEMTTELLERPDGVTPYGTWIREVMEDLLVLDAPSIYVNTTDPMLTKFEVIDGATIKRIVNERGRSPEPPEPAYLQRIKGLPAWYYSTDELIYLPRNPRPHKFYGMSPVQQIITTVNVALRRVVNQLQYYTQGNIPDALISVPETWTPEQIAAFQNQWDSLHEGNTAQRRRAKFVPGKTNIMQTVEPALKTEFDEWLARVACFAFSVSPHAFIKGMNRAEADTAREQALAEGLGPLMLWRRGLMNRVIQYHLKQTDLEFADTVDDETDPQVRASVHDTYLKNGVMCINDVREDLGRPPVDNGDVHMIYATAPVRLEDAVKEPPDPMEMMQPGGPDDSQPKEGDPDKAPPKGGSGAPAAAPKEKEADSKKKPVKEEVGEKAARPFDRGTSTTKAEWNEEDHPRDDNGQFTSGGGGGGGGDDDSDGGNVNHTSTWKGGAYTKVEKSAVESYTGGEAESLNQYLRDPSSVSAEEAKNLTKISKGLDKALNRTTTTATLTTYRGVSNFDTVVKVAEGKEGKLIMLGRGYTSVSKDESVAQAFAGKSGGLVEIKVPKGSSAIEPHQLISTWGSLHTGDPHPTTGKDHPLQEVILPRLQTFRVVSVDKKARRVKLEVV